MSSAGDKSSASEGGDGFDLSWIVVEELEWREIVKENSWVGEEEDGEEEEGWWLFLSMVFWCCCVSITVWQELMKCLVERERERDGKVLWSLFHFDVWMEC